jgi:hypothetical protein
VLPLHQLARSFVWRKNWLAPVVLFLNSAISPPFINWGGYGTDMVGESEGVWEEAVVADFKRVPAPSLSE